MKEIEDMVDEWQSDPAYVIVETVTEYFNITREQILSTDRSPRFSHPRMLAMVLLRQMTGMTFEAIADIFGKHHSTVMHAEKRAKASLHATQHLAALRKRVESAEEI